MLRKFLIIDSSKSKLVVLVLIITPKRLFDSDKGSAVTDF